jgi:hypothetical protein
VVLPARFLKRSFRGTHGRFDQIEVGFEVLALGIHPRLCPDGVFRNFLRRYSSSEDSKRMTRLILHGLQPCAADEGVPALLGLRDTRRPRDLAKLSRHRVHSLVPRMAARAPHAEVRCTRFAPPGFAAMLSIRSDDAPAA